MLTTNRFFLPLALVLAIALSACGDSSTLGVDLLDSQVGLPEIVELPTSTLGVQPARDVTGNARRALVGVVDDPLTGTVRSSAGIDFASAVVLSEAFRNGPVSSVELLLVSDYRYGDTTATIDVSIREIPEEWTAAGSDSQDRIPSGNEITTATLNGVDSLQTVEMPAEWIDANSALIRTTDFTTGFHGLLFEPVAGNLVTGFNAAATNIRVVSGEDTVDFIVTRSLSRIRRETAATLPPNIALLQDGVGEGLQLDFGFESSELIDVALNRAILSVPFDSAQVLSTPPNFVRPLLRQVDLAGVTADSLVIPITAGIPSDGRLVFDSAALRNTIQSALLEQPIFERLVLTGQLGLTPFQNTINVLLVRSGPDPLDRPRLILTVISPLDS